MNYQALLIISIMTEKWVRRKIVFIFNNDWSLAEVICEYLVITCRGDKTNKGLEKVIIHLKKSCQKDAFFIDRIIIEYIQNLTYHHGNFSVLK